MTDDDLIRRGDALRVADEVFDKCENVNGDDRGAFAAAEVGARIAALAPTYTAQALKEAMGEDALSPYMKTTEATVVTIKPMEG